MSMGDCTYKMDVIPYIADRMSIRAYKPDLVEKEKIDRILEAGCRAPSAKNRQPWRFIVVQDQNVRTRIQLAAFGQDHVGQAPVIIAACTTNVDYKMPNGQLSYPIDISFAVSFMMIQAEAENLGTCVVTTFDERDLKEILNIPYSMRVVMLLLAGYTAEKPFPASRKPIQRMISKNHW